MQNISSQELKILLVGIVLKDLLTYSSVVARDQSFCLDNTKLPVHPYTTALPFSVSVAGILLYPAHNAVKDLCGHLDGSALFITLLG